jgi:hypothetical protein
VSVQIQFTIAVLTVCRVCQDITESFWQTGLGGLYYPFTETYKDLAALSSAVGDGFDYEFAAGWFHYYTVTHNPCSPTISVPSQLLTINSLWSDCANDLSGLFDPPYTLTQGSGLEAISVTVPAPVASLSADPVSPAASKFFQPLSMHI